MEKGILASIGLLLILVVLSGAVASLLILRGTKRDMRASRLYLWASLPGVVAVGVFGVVYFLSYSTDYLAVSLFISLLMLASWVVGFGFCAALELVFRKIGLWNDVPQRKG